VNGKVIKPSPGKSWEMQTSFTRQVIGIQCRPKKGNRVEVTYVNETLAKPAAKTTAPTTGKAAKDDL
jgi:hypothetical protein